MPITIGDHIFGLVLLALIAWGIIFRGMLGHSLIDWVMALACMALVALPVAAALRLLIRTLAH
jgi:hypothetical protein